MSLSLPKLVPGTAFVGLFADHCWLQGRQANISLPLETGADASQDHYLEALVSLLGKAKQQLRRGTRLVLTVSDSLAAFTMLPWQDELQRPAEWEGYARILFEKQGRSLDPTWLLHTEFARYKSNGVAYALSSKWMAQLEEAVQTRGFQLASVLPVSAAAYCRLPKTKKLGTSLLLLIERHRMTALCVDATGLQSVDIEPVIASSESSGMRLLRRAISTHQNFWQVHIWSPVAEERGNEAAFIKTIIPSTEIKKLPHGVWGQ
ncbi:hypothetical protein [Undibacterium terreum]|uniref:Uncharacterized protein n=1 Tax=Undibacterium terreum TaxID=1224302 RepID=A0A916UTS1_9BURK|nr:hypothetical protein [Undibacterium terreum]GGC87242.1 hypothetical protein GCM10011396_38150 [Undibacterium terreum]